MVAVGVTAAVVSGGDVAILLVHQAAGGSRPSGCDGLWLAGFALFCASMAVALRSRVDVRVAGIAVAVQSACVLTMAVAVPCYSAAFLLAWVAWQAGWFLHRRAALALVAGQAAVFALLGAALSWMPPDAADVAMQIVLQGLALGAALSVRREAQGRVTVEALHAELERAQGRLAERSRAEERARLARELHDVLGHHLVALNLDLEIAARKAGGSSSERAPRANLQRAQRLTRALLADLRWVVRAFRDAPVDLGASIHALVCDLERPRPHVAIDEELSAVSPLGADALARCVQEMVTNVLKHAGADNVWIDLRCRDGFAEACVRDDGSGGEAAEGGLGLLGMRERLALLDGELVVSRPPGGGWSVTARVPLGSGEESP
jgi:signal transduction histidine kinase